MINIFRKKCLCGARVICINLKSNFRHWICADQCSINYEFRFKGKDIYNEDCYFQGLIIENSLANKHSMITVIGHDCVVELNNYIQIDVKSLEKLKDLLIIV